MSLAREEGVCLFQLSFQTLHAAGDFHTEHNRVGNQRFDVSAVARPPDQPILVPGRVYQQPPNSSPDIHTAQHTPTDHGRQRAKLQSDFMTPTYATYTPWL